MQGIMLLHKFLSGLQQAPRRKQPEDVQRRRHILESFSGRMAPGVADRASWPLNGPTLPPPLAQAPGPSDATRPAHHAQPYDALQQAGVDHACDSPQSTAGPAGDDPVAARSHAATPPQSMPTGDMVHFQVDHVFEVFKVGTVLSGTTVRGTIELGATLWWGPQEAAGEFALVAVRGIHRSRVPVAKVLAGECATIAIEQLLPPCDDGSGRLPRPESPNPVTAPPDAGSAPLSRRSAGTAAPRPQSPLARPQSPLARPPSTCSAPLSDSGMLAGTAAQSGDATDPRPGDIPAHAGGFPPGPHRSRTGSPRCDQDSRSGAASPFGAGAPLELASPSHRDSNVDTPGFGLPAQAHADAAPAGRGALPQHLNLVPSSAAVP